MTKRIKADKDYLAEYSAKDLLKEYGAGNPIPGSGSANALSTLLAIGMMKTVCKITLQKSDYKNIHKLIQSFLVELEEKFEPLLEQLFQKDIEVFNRVIEHRRCKAATKDELEKEEFRRKELDELKEATEIQIQICQICLKLFDSASSIFDWGYKAVRGDSGVAISSLLSASFGCLFVIFLNLKSFPEGEWLVSTKGKAEELTKQLNNFHVLGFEKVLDLYEELKKPNRHFRVELFSDS